MHIHHPIELLYFFNIFIFLPARLGLLGFFNAGLPSGLDKTFFYLMVLLQHFLIILYCLIVYIDRQHHNWYDILAQLN